MNVKITENICEVENNIILNAGEYNIHEFHFNFSEEYLDEYVKKALFIDKDGTPYEMVIANNKCDIPNELLDEPGEYLFGVYAYEVNGNELLLRYSPEPTHFYVNKGSYKPNAHTPTEPTPDEFAQYYQAMQELIANAKIELIGYIDENLPTVDIGGTSTLEPGSEATVINVGTDRNPIFVFGIPKGDPGTTDYNELENRPDLSVYALIRESANKIALDIDNETFKMKAKIFDKNNNLISESNIIDLPLESVVVSGEYDSQTQKLILTLENGNTIEVPLSGLVSGLVSEEELTNRLNTAIKIETISKNGTRIPIYNKNVDISVPSSTNELINNSGFITTDVTNLTHYYDKVASDTRYPLVSESANSLTMNLDTTTYVLTATLKDRNGRIISTQNVEFPINSILSDINDLDLNKANVSDLNDEIIARQNADTGLQNQIDAITSASDVVDVVSTYSDLNNYDTTKLTDKDVIKVMQDENHSNAISYYRWNELSETFTYIGSEGPFYTKGETDTLLNGKVDNSMLDDYVRFTDYATNDKTGVVKANPGQYGINVSSTTGTIYGSAIPYNSYTDKLDGYFISKGTLENVITGKNLETANNKITTIDENSTDTQYPSAKCVYNSQKIQNDEIDGLKTLYNILPTDTNTGETISMDNTGEAIFKRIDLKGNTSQETIAAEVGTNIENTSISINDVNTSKEHAIGLNGNTTQEVIPAETGTNVNSTSISISDVNTDKEHAIELSGNTYQKSSILPSEYTQVDYIQSTGNQYIDTGINADYKLSVKAKISIPSVQQSTAMFGVMSGTDSADRVRHHFQIANFISYWAGKGDSGCQTVLIQPLTIDDTYDIFCDIYNKKYYLNNVEIQGKFNSNDFDTGLNYYLFGRNRGNNVDNFTVIKLYSFKMYYANVLVRDFIPCYRNSDNVIGLYDIVNNVFYPNNSSSTITFTYGSTVSIPNPDYQQNIEVVTGQNNVKIVGKNLFDKSLFETFTTSIKYIEMTLKPNTTYTMSSNIPTQSNNTDNANLFFMLDGQSASSSTNGIKPNQPRTQTTDATGKVKIGYRDFQNEYTDEANTYWYMLEQGSTATTYEAYTGTTYPINLGNIELCKISTYQDRIYKQNDKWYLEKNVGKVVLNGSEGHWFRTSINTNTLRFNNETAIPNGYVISAIKIMSNKFINGSGPSDNRDYEHIRNGGSDYTNSLSIIIDKTRLPGNTANDFTNWLSNNNVTVYYLANATTTEITDTNLVNQLNALYNATIYPITNINTDTSNLLPYIDLQYNVVTPAPSPSRPSVVNVVKGNNTIIIEGKNLANFINCQPYTYSSGVPVGVLSTTIITNKTNNSYDVAYGSNNFIGVLSDTMFFEANTDYVFSFNRAYKSAFTQRMHILQVNDDNSYTLLYAINSGVYGNPYQYTYSNTTAKKVAFMISTNSSNPKNETETISEIMVRKSSLSGTYEPYVSQTYPINLSNIELCKISTYKDRIYPLNNKWYLEKQIGKIVLNGTQPIIARGTYTAGYNRFAIDIGTNIYMTSNNNEIAPFYCNEFIPITRTNSYNNINGIFPGVESSFDYYRSLGIYYDATKEMTSQQFQTWLSQNNVIVYYPYATSTTTEITDTTLVSQLNALSNSTLYSITNINTETSNLLPYIDLHYNFVTPSPSPNRPSVVNVVKGNNTVAIEGKNLLDPSTIEIGTKNGITSTYNSTTQEITFNGTCSTDNTQITVSTNIIPFISGTTKVIGYYVSGSLTNSGVFRTFSSGWSNYDGVNIYQLNSSNPMIIKTTTFNVNKNLFSFRFDSGAVATNFTIKLMITNSDNTTFAPYSLQTYPINLGNIELCKISTYQDYFYKDNGNWYKHSAISKVVLNGSEDWQKSSRATVNRYFVGSNQTPFINTILNKYTIDIISDYFNCIAPSSSDNDAIGLAKYNASGLMINFSLNDIAFDTLNKFTNWLSTHNAIVYYVLGTPTDTQITDTTLITQLDNLQKAISYDSQTNISQTNTDKPFIITAEMFLSLKNILNQGSGE